MNFLLIFYFNDCAYAANHRFHSTSSSMKSSISAPKSMLPSPTPMKSSSLVETKNKKEKLSVEKKSMCRNSDDDEEDKQIEEEVALTISELSSSKRKKKNSSKNQPVKNLNKLSMPKTKKKEEKVTTHNHDNNQCKHAEEHRRFEHFGLKKECEKNVKMMFG